MTLKKYARVKDTGKKKKRKDDILFAARIASIHLEGRQCTFLRVLRIFPPSTVRPFPS